MSHYKVAQVSHRLGHTTRGFPKIVPLYTVKTSGGKEIAVCETKYLADKVVRALELEYAAVKSRSPEPLPTFQLQGAF